MAAHQAPPSLGFSRQEHWSGLPFPSPMHESEKWKWRRSVISDSYRPHGLQPTRLLRLWNFPRWSGVPLPSPASERGECKSWLKTQHSENEVQGIWSYHFTANRWENNGTVTDFIFLGSKITADGDYSHEIKRCLLFGRKAKSRTLLFQQRSV